MTGAVRTTLWNSLGGEYGEVTKQTLFVVYRYRQGVTSTCRAFRLNRLS
jgi:hypothetical protein